MKTPILKSHDPRRENVLGYVEPTERGLKVKLKKGTYLTKEQVFHNFGNIAHIVGEMVEVDKDVYGYNEFTISAFHVDEVPSFLPPPHVSDTPTVKILRSLFECAPESAVIRERLRDWFNKQVLQYSSSFGHNPDMPNDEYMHRVIERFTKIGVKIKDDQSSFVEELQYNGPMGSVGGETRFHVFVIANKDKYTDAAMLEIKNLTNPK